MRTETKIIGITGSSGFVGGSLVQALRARSGVRLRFFDRPKGDLLAPDHERLDRFVRECDVIVHTAAATRGGDHELIIGNVVATHNLLTALVRTRSRAKLIFLSSSAVDFPQTRRTYGLAKELVELMVRDFSGANGRFVSVLRLTNVFGPGSRPFHNSVVSTFCFQVARGEKLVVNKNGAPLMLVYVDTVVRAILSEIFAKRKRLFHFRRVYSKNTITIAALARLILSFRTLAGPSSIKKTFYRNLYQTYQSFLPSQRTSRRT